MRTIYIIIVFLSIGSFSFGQEQEHDFEKKYFYELNKRASFHEVNSKYEMQEDTIFYTNSGFLISTEWDEVIINNNVYVILTYPNFSAGSQSASDPAVKLASGANPIRHPLKNLNGKLLAMPKDEFEKISKAPIYSINFRKWKNYRVTAGQLTLPFKLRPKIGDRKFQMTTDVTIGAYGGIRKRISRRSPTYITLPFVLGLSFINVNENTTTYTGSADLKSGITPGWSWATGFVVQTNRLNLGFVLGKDYASGYAEDWIYHNNTWHSFAIGYSFLK